jgi:hypothetical protein
MAQDEVDLSSLVRHIQRIERGNRYGRLATIFLLLTVLCSLTTTLLSQETMSPPDLRGKMIGPPDLRAQTVQSERFQLMDNGLVRGELSMRDGKPVLELYDTSGKVTWSTSANRLEVIGAGTH